MAEPLAARGPGDGPRVAAHAHGVERLREVVLAAQRAREPRERVARPGDGHGERSGAAEDGAPDALAVLRKVDAGDVAPQRVAKEEVGHVPANALGDKNAQLVLVLHEHLGAVARRQAAVTARLGGGAVADMVVPADDEALCRKEPGEGVVALHVLGHPMDDLHDAPRPPLGRPLRPPDERAKGGAPVGRGEAQPLAPEQPLAPVLWCGHVPTSAFFSPSS